MFVRVAILALSTVTIGGAAEPSAVDFRRDVWPILSRSCIECHGAREQRGKLRLDSRQAMLRGGSSGPAVVVGKPDDSELVRRISLPNVDRARMPNRGQPLPQQHIATLRAWIAQGVVWPEGPAHHWAYVAPVRPPFPAIAAHSWTCNPFDRFILADHERASLKPSPPASRVLLLRRASLDLTGIPPTPDEVDHAIADNRPDWYERWIDRLLASPRFGERWARHWLDLARYADSHGYQRDDLRDIWPYRDWVIKALNADMPFDQFTIEQLAGDLLPTASESQRVATGFHRCSTINVEAGSDPEESRVNQVLDRVNTTATVWLGTTLECAQCHDHKYDPFSQRDYYQMFAFFNGTIREAERNNPNVPGSIKFTSPKMTVRGGFTLVMQELPKPRDTFILQRGDFLKPGEKVSAATPAMFPPMPAGPANRLALARWLVARDNPLTARVFVNRVFAEIMGQGIVSTLEDFGVKGDSPSHPQLLDWLAVDFMDHGWSIKHLIRTIVTSAAYQQSSRITPELAQRDHGNRLLARSTRFRLDAEAVRDNALAIAGLLASKPYGPPVRPPQPEGLWTKVGGEKIEYVVSTGLDRYRRGIYLVWKRASPNPSMMNFDAAARLTCTVKRSRSNTPLQALTLLNDPVYVEAATALARRIPADRPADNLDERLRYGFRLCVAREPRAAELAVLRDLWTKQRRADSEPAAWFAVATTLLNLDETITRP